MKKDNINIQELINDPVFSIRCFHCKTKESAVYLLNELSKLGYKSIGGDDFRYDCWRFLGESTCYILDLYSSKTVTVCSYDEANELFDFMCELGLNDEEFHIKCCNRFSTDD